MVKKTAVKVDVKKSEAKEDVSLSFGDKKVLLFKGASAEEEAAAKRSSWDMTTNKNYFRYNLPLQISLVYCIEGDSSSGIDPEKSKITNWMPRKGEVCEMTLAELFGPDVTPRVIVDFTTAAAACLKNLGTQMRKLGLRKTDAVIYPNCEDGG